jgi:hypothetical protein
MAETQQLVDATGHIGEALHVRALVALDGVEKALAELMD